MLSNYSNREGLVRRVAGILVFNSVDVSNYSNREGLVRLGLMAIRFGQWIRVSNYSNREGLVRPNELITEMENKANGFQLFQPRRAGETEKGKWI